jgi:hypothetical protein
MMGYDKHDGRVRELWIHPEQAGLEGVVLSAREVRMIRDNQLIGEVDNVYWTKNGSLYLLEHKCNGHPSPRLEAHAMVQLTRARLHFYEYLSTLGVMLYSHGEIVEVIE